MATQKFLSLPKHEEDVTSGELIETIKLPKVLK